jgi:hypothetical protein
MKASLRALLAGVIDYAGLFPPAKLPLEEALANYQRYREGPDAWMLGRFVCPAARLKEIPEGVTLNCSATGRGGDSNELLAWLTALEEDLADIEAARAQVEVLEVKLPARLLSPGQGLPDLLTMISSNYREAKLAFAFEAPVTERGEFSRLLGALRECEFRERAVFKLRAGGLEAKAFPTCEQVAEALVACHRARLPLKATAGLHHPLPRFDPALQARMHGIINLFVAGVLVHARGIDPATAQAILEEEDASRFRFEDGALYWGDLKATTGEIAEARRDAVLSFGSCSFDEPRDDLRALGWIR